jgi:hypothetical protein
MNAGENQNPVPADAPDTAWQRRSAPVAKRGIGTTVCLASLQWLGSFSRREQARHFTSRLCGADQDAVRSLARIYFPQ